MIRIRLANETIQAARLASPRRRPWRRSAGPGRRADSAACAVGSTSPCSMARTSRSGLHQILSMVAKMRPALVCPTRWPERPTRCRPWATLLGDCNCTTRSTAADVDAQLKRAGADQRRQPACLQVALQLHGASGATCCRGGRGSARRRAAAEESHVRRQAARGERLAAARLDRPFSSAVAGH